MLNPQAFRIQRTWVYTLEREAPRSDRIELGAKQDRQFTLLSRNAVEVEMRYGEGRKRTHVPDNVSEEQMVQLLVSGFGENVRKQWQVKTRNMSQRVMEAYKLVPAWSYELVPRQEAAPPPQPGVVRARTRYQGLNWDIELDASWSQMQVHEAIKQMWQDEWEKRGRPHTEIEVRDERDYRTRFMVHEGWTYVLQERDLRGPDWLNEKEYTTTKRPPNPNAAVLVGLQLENGMRIEHTVLAGTEETKLKRIMWQELSPPEGRFFLRIRNARNEESDSYEISRQWTYILSRQPKRQTARRKGTEEGNANVKLRLSWKRFEKHVTAKRDWNEERATIEFKKLAGVQQSLPCRLQVYNQKGEKVPFEINTAFSYLLVAR
jgi:hypothetical protein